MDKEELELLKKLSFEEALQELESIVSQMERGELLLDDMMNAYEKGQALSFICSKKLKSVEKKVEILKNKVNKEGVWEEFDPNETQTSSIQSSVPISTSKQKAEPVVIEHEPSNEDFLF